MRSLRLIVLVLCGALAPCLFFQPDPAGARPGGGQNYRAPSPPPYRAPYTPPPSYSRPGAIPVPIPSNPYDRRYQGDSGGGNFLAWLIVLGIIGLVLWMIFRRKTAQRAEIRADQGAQQ